MRGRNSDFGMLALLPAFDRLVDPHSRAASVSGLSLSVGGSGDGDVLTTHPAVNFSLTTQHHKAFDRSDCLHGRAVSLPDSWLTLGVLKPSPLLANRSIASSAPSPAMERDHA